MSVMARLGHAASPRASSKTLNSSPISAGERRLHRRCRADVIDRVRRANAAEQVEQSAADQERRLRREPGDVHARALRRLGMP